MSADEQFRGVNVRMRSNETLVERLVGSKDIFDPF